MQRLLVWLLLLTLPLSACGPTTTPTPASEPTPGYALPPQFRFDPEYGMLQGLSNTGEWVGVDPWTPPFGQGSYLPQRLNPDDLVIEVQFPAIGWIPVTPQVRSPYGEILPQCDSVSPSLHGLDFTPREAQAFRYCDIGSGIGNGVLGLGLDMEASNMGTEAFADALLKDRILAADDKSDFLRYFPDPQWTPAKAVDEFAEVVERDAQGTTPVGSYYLVGRIGSVLLQVNVRIDDWWQGQTNDLPPIGSHPQVQQARRAFELILSNWHKSRFAEKPLRVLSAISEVQEQTGARWQPVTPMPPTRVRADEGVEVWLDQAWWPLLFEPPVDTTWLPGYLDELKRVQPTIPGQILITVKEYDQVRGVFHHN